MSKSNVQLWCPESFKKKVKIESIEKGYPSMNAYLNDLSKDGVDLAEELLNKKKKRGFDFGF